MRKKNPDELRAEIERLHAQIELLKDMVLNRKVVQPDHQIPDAVLRLFTPKQHAVLRMIWRGATTREMAMRLGVSDSTIKEHVGALMQKLGAKNRLEVMAKTRAMQEVAPDVYAEIAGVSRTWDEKFDPRSEETKKLRMKTR